jgi:UDP-3-O-[3-hydroxymyristoyl] N-acetylglucosamine deacetylase
MSADVVVLEGRGLHTGAPGRVTLRRTDAPRVMFCGGAGTPAWTLGELVPVASERCTVVASRDGRFRVSTIEHLLAALGGLRVREGLEISIEGPEVPLLDGGAMTFVEALESLGSGPVPSAPFASAPLRVVAAGTVDVGSSRYVFTPSNAATLEVEVDFDIPGLTAGASWDGDPGTFRARLAPARTFGLEEEVLRLVERGLASHVAPESVVVLGRERILSAGAPFASDEPARHKLLDLIGDLTLHGGPPRGAVFALRPGHAATHAAVARALAVGLLGPGEP